MGKIDADAPSAVSTGAAGFVVVGGVGDGTRHACEEAPSPAPPSSPMAPPTPTRRFEGFKKIRFLKKNAEGSSNGSVRDGVDLPSSKVNSTTNSTTASALADNDGARPSSSSSSNSSSPPAAVPANAKELRDHVAKFTTRSDRLGALVVAETAVGWLLTAAAPTLIDRYFAARRRFSSSTTPTPTTPSSAFFAALPALLFYLAWGALRACSYVRTVILMHDLVHGIVFTSRRANAIAAAVSGICAWTSAANFGRNHRRHHARLGVEEEIDFDADHTVFWTVKEWSAWRPSASKVLARVLRDPLVYHFVTAPGYLLFFGSTCPGKKSFLFLFSSRGGEREREIKHEKKTHFSPLARKPSPPSSSLCLSLSLSHTHTQQATVRASRPPRPSAASCATTGRASSASSAASPPSPPSPASSGSSSSSRRGGRP